MMPISKEERDEIIAIVLNSKKSDCLCGLNGDSQAEMGHLFGRLRDLGNGNLSCGIERFSRAVGLMAKVSRCGEKVGGAVAVFIVISILGGFGLLIRMGIEKALEKGGP
ncbi:MAG: hypothetical protein RBT11_19030 [Desulfobacterales bacterium]|jgi:hypothetical protein|nr:hypothetical protein [Desulfobacterales bacterium]